MENKQNNDSTQAQIKQLLENIKHLSEDEKEELLKQWNISYEQMIEKDKTKQ